MKTKEETLKKPKSGYWYKFYYEECVLCGDYDEYKKRRYAPKPKDPNERYEYSEYVCGAHFL